MAEPWLSGYVSCERCGHRWMAVRPLSAPKLECPHCHKMSDGTKGMKSNTWLDVARGGALAHWLMGPLMLLAGIFTRHISLIVLGTLSFGVGIWILQGTER